MTKRDIIDFEIKKFKSKKRKVNPSFIIINRDEYFVLKEEMGYDFDKDISLLAGCEVLVSMKMDEPIRVM
mgnify:FL=1